MSSWIAATVLAVTAWLASSLYLWLVRRRENETAAGLNALVGLHWRDFSRMVRRAMREQRDLQDPILEADTCLEPKSDFMMVRGGERWLLSCKHGRAYRIGSSAVNELGTTARMMGARGGILITEGKVERDGIAAAEKQSVEILDGRRIWPMLKPYLPSELEDEVIGASRRRAQRHITIAALAALTLGLLLGIGGVLQHVGAAEPATGTAQVAIAHTPVAIHNATILGADSAQSIHDHAADGHADNRADIAPADPASEQNQRHSISKVLARTPGVIRGIWQTPITLVIDRSGEDDQVWPRICNEVERYSSLRTVRIQLNPRPGHAEPVRWRQCQTF
ncbi:restriction endonuclease [Xanthomonas sp. MUS 060]|uniref:restriction endonuclease n=1 Tax=Xanthomonas sp. MUS 060 TaxID=1588031 RepID=UPI000B325D86|nr:restriction endonuclease [Xanthomonas sp. MUS 060]